MDYFLNYYRHKKLGDKYFITTDHGSNCVLSEDEFKKLKQNKIDKNLKSKLTEREIIINEFNLTEAIRLTRNRNSFLYSGTSLHIIVITLRCNLNCIYCHASPKSLEKKEFDMDKETAKKTVDFIFQSPSKGITIEFQGGEPLLNWDVVKQVIEYARGKNKEAKKTLMITIVSNLTKMDEEKMKYLIDNDVIVCTSLDGPKELHDYNRRFLNGSSNDHVVKWIKRFNEEYKKKGIKNKKIGALVTLTRKSLKYPKEIVDEYVRLGLSDIHMRFLNNLGVAKQAWSDISYSVQDYLTFWKKAVEYIETLKKKGVKINERMVSIMINKMNNEFDPDYLDLRSPCGAAIGQLAYNHDGKIYTCDEGRMLGEDNLFLLGNVMEDNYKDIITSNKACAVINASINDQYACNDCAYKPYCGICPVCNYTEQGNVIAKISQTGRCKIYMEQFNWVVKNKFMN
ncbi:His-Xaa-Ser system radical SAM maturase HxsB [Candidatus Woesearchaeota archaeon]|nr:His-Xaa-Ser system radical SAM maturase HxsB [Candidatus Woesearchaeota archaeon]|tara:strand:- start:1503 stop:2867 length:1365 start_codon:yes stop_codon:yes gene_type:complete